MIGLISSVPLEGKTIAKHLGKHSAVGGKPFYSGNIGGKALVYVTSGMGKVNAAHAATILIERYSPELIILFGVGGAYPTSGLVTGDIAVAEKEIYGDEGVLTKEGFRGADFIGIPLVSKGRKRSFGEFPLDKGLVRMVMSKLRLHAASAEGAPRDFRIMSGNFVTVSTCSGTGKRGRELEKRFKAACENMEGAAVAHVCAMYGIPLVEIRGISNIVEDRDMHKWDIPLAAKNVQKAVLNLLKHS